MNKVKILATAAVFLIQSSAIAFFVYRAQSLQKKVLILEPDHEKLEKDRKEVQNKYNNLLKEVDAVKYDRDNLIMQAKSLLGERSRAAQMQSELEKVKSEKSVVVTEREDGKKENIALGTKIKLLQLAQEKLTEERDKYREALDKTRIEATLRNLNNEISDLKKEKGSLQERLKEIQGNSRKAADSFQASLKQTQKEAGTLKTQNLKLGDEKEQLSKNLEDYKNKITDAQKKNKTLEEYIKNMPKKFSELARQNKLLIKQTSQMHYNLGVFYTKNKQYDRALAEFERVVEINPDDSDAHFNLGYIYAEYLINRKKAIEHFRHFLRLAKGEDKDVDWVKKYLLTWETYEGKQPIN